MKLVILVLEALSHHDILMERMSKYLVLQICNSGLAYKGAAGTPEIPKVERKQFQ